MAYDTRPADGAPEAPPTVVEAARTLPVVRRADVLVCGGGPAGVTAAIAAARAGAKTQLVELHGQLGGIWTSGALGTILDPEGKPGLVREIVDALRRRGAGTWRPNMMFAADPEAIKLLLEELCLEAGVSLHYLTRVVAAARSSENRLAVAITESKSGREAWGAEVFVDATGDGDLAALAGCGFDLGHPETGACQPLSLIGVLTGLRWAEVRRFTTHERGKPALLDEMRRAGVTPTYLSPTLICVHEGLFLLMANHEYGVSAVDADALTTATVRARAEVHRLVAALRGLDGPWRDVQLVTTGAQIGVREGRRVHGRYTVTAEDALTGARHEDAVCRVGYPVDVHSTSHQREREKLAARSHAAASGAGAPAANGSTVGGAPAAHGSTTGGKATGGAWDAPMTLGASPPARIAMRGVPYDVPLRALIARDVDGLLLAGRCISGDHVAHGNYRVTGNAAALGQAAGTLAAVAARTGRLPHHVPWPDVREALHRLGIERLESERLEVAAGESGSPTRVHAPA